MQQQIYLDYAASTPCDQRVIDETLPFFSTNYANPSNTTGLLGKEANFAIEIARKKVANLFNCLPQNIIWTAGATESNNIAIQGAYKKYRKQNPNSKYHIISSSIEHKSVIETLKSLENADVSFIKPNHDGVTQVKEIEDCITENTFLISLMMVNNELGILNDINAISKICQKKNILLHTDATQAIGKLPIDLGELKVDFFSISGHKIYAPKGIGALYVRDFSKISPLYYGGGQEKGYRPGTLNVSGIVGLGIACEICKSIQDEESIKIKNLRDFFECKILELNKDIVINGGAASRAPHISNISFPLKAGANVMEHVNLIACSSGSACDSFEKTPSHVLAEIGKQIHESKNTLRFSFGRFTSIEEINLAIKHLKDILNLYLK